MHGLYSSWLAAPTSCITTIYHHRYHRYGIYGGKRWRFVFIYVLVLAYFMFLCVVLIKKFNCFYSPQLLFTCRSPVYNFLQLSNGFIDLLHYCRRSAVFQLYSHAHLFTCCGLAGRLASWSAVRALPCCLYRGWHVLQPTCTSVVPAGIKRSTVSPRHSSVS